MVSTQGPDAVVDMAERRLNSSPNQPLERLVQDSNASLDKLEGVQKTKQAGISEAINTVLPSVRATMFGAELASPLTVQKSLLGC